MVIEDEVDYEEVESLPPSPVFPRKEIHNKKGAAILQLPEKLSIAL